MQDFEEAFGEHLVRGDARNFFTALNSPLRGRKYDAILSHLLVNNVSREAGLEIVGNCVQALAPLGEARIQGFTIGQLNNDVEPFLRHLEKSSSMELKIEIHETDNVWLKDSWLLVIKRIR
jgi:hypothetical protein